MTISSDSDSQQEQQSIKQGPELFVGLCLGRRVRPRNVVEAPLVFFTHVWQCEVEDEAHLPEDVRQILESSPPLCRRRRPDDYPY